MATATVALMTTDDLLALPEDGVERWLIRGELREKPMTKRNRWHCGVMARVTKFLGNWLDDQPEPRGDVLCGEAGVILKRDPDTTVGIDVVYISAELVAKPADDTTMIDGVPTLVVEILSPYDTQQEVREKKNTYLEAGVKVVWILDPDDRIVRVYRPGAKPVLLNEDQELAGEPELPGFRVSVAKLFP